jgi:hypothetical protein
MLENLVMPALYQESNLGCPICLQVTHTAVDKRGIVLVLWAPTPHKKGPSYFRMIDRLSGLYHVWLLFDGFTFY